jgi:hypothetical protein
VDGKKRMTRTLIKIIIAAVLGLAVFDGRAQSLTIVNNSYCKLNYQLYGSLNTPCGNECSVKGTIASKKTQTWKSSSAIKWDCTTEVVFWRAFALNYIGAEKIGNCSNAAPFSGVIQAGNCYSDVEYSWNVEEETGDITIVISPVVFPKKIFSLKLEPSAIQGGVNVLIIPMLEISNYIELGNDARWSSNESFRVRTNQRFIANILPAKKGQQIHATLVADTSGSYSKVNVCSYLPLNETQQYGTLHCYCGTDQKFTEP